MKEACATFCRAQKRSLAQLKKLQISKREVQQFMTVGFFCFYCFYKALRSFYMIFLFYKVSFIFKFFQLARIETVQSLYRETFSLRLSGYPQ